MLPGQIEKKSFSIIEKEAGDHGFSPEKWAVVARMIHTSADFEYLETARFHPDAIHAGVGAIRSGKAVITDTRMAFAGIRKKALESRGCAVTCMIDDLRVAEQAVSQGTTRAQAAVDSAAEIMKGGIYVVGNAPTALFRLIELVNKKQAAPALIVGLPVGFVNAAESKEALLELDLPYITNVGRKGGSNVAAAVVNALIILADA